MLDDERGSNSNREAYIWKETSFQGWRTSNPVCWRFSSTCDPLLIFSLARGLAEYIFSFTRVLARRVFILLRPLISLSLDVSARAYTHTHTYKRKSARPSRRPPRSIFNIVSVLARCCFLLLSNFIVIWSSWACCYRLVVDARVRILCCVGPLIKGMGCKQSTAASTSTHTHTK